MPKKLESCATSRSVTNCSSICCDSVFTRLTGKLLSICATMLRTCGIAFAGFPAVRRVNDAPCPVNGA